MLCRSLCFAASLTFVAICSFAQASEPATTADRPNILWLSTEDIGPHLGCYGCDVKTPNLDAFAKRSLTYDVAWSTYPVCAPCRTTIITGMYATALGAGNMRCGALKPEGLKLLPELMRDAGYYCTNASKTDYNLLDVADVWDESSSKAHWKNRPDGKPFFAVFNQTSTHESKVRKRPHEKQIDPASVSLFPYWPDTPEVRQDWAQYLDNIQTMDGWFAAHLKQLEDAGLADDTIVVFWGDHGAGMARHKRYAGDSGMRVPLIAHVPEKWKKFWSSNYAAGARSDWPVGFVDFAPTVLKIAGVEIPNRMQGESFLGADAKKAKYVFGVRNRMDERYDVSRSVCDGRFVYIRNFMPHLPHGQFVEYQQTNPSTRVWFEKFGKGELNEVQSAFWKPRPTEELFDLQADPHETVNLASDNSHVSKLTELRKAMRTKMIQIGDLDLVPESTLHEFEQATGKPRAEYANEKGFRLKDVLDAANGKNITENLDSNRVELQFWALVNLIHDVELPDMPTRKSISSILKNSKSMALRVKAAEFYLSKGQASKEVIEILVHLADKSNSNYYVACNALDCLDRYRDEVDADSIARIQEMDPDASEIERGNDNLNKLHRRFGKPRVLILGDSISIGYTPFVQKALAEEASVFRPMKNGKPENCAGTDRGLKSIDRWLKMQAGQWDVIHVNFGLHDLQHVDPMSGAGSQNPNDPLQSNPQDYEKQLDTILIKAKATGAKVIVCTTTPVPPGCKPLRETTAPSVYNEIAKRLAAEHDCPVNDLFSFANTRLDEIQKPANVHFTPEGSKLLAGEVVKAIREQLGE
jgi:uncharacterized sulfatase